MNAINKTLFFGVYLITKVIALFFLLGPLIWSMGDVQQGDLPFLLISYFFDILALVVFVVLIYKMWNAIPVNIRRTTPERGVGFLFIPLFNLYWWFTALWGWSQDWNIYSSKSNNKSARVSEILPLAIAILFFLAGTVGVVLSLTGNQLIAAILSIPNCILVPVFILIVCDALNASPKIGKENCAGLTSFILGVLGILLPFIGFILGILAIVFSEKQRKIMPEPLARTGLITGIIAIAIWAFADVFALIYFLVV